MAKKSITEKDQAYIATIERFRKAANVSRSEIIDELRYMAIRMIEQDHEDYESTNNAKAWKDQIDVMQRN